MGEYALPIHLLCLRFPMASTLAGLTQISHNFTLPAPLLYAMPSTLCQHRHVMVAPVRAQVPKWNATVRIIALTISRESGFVVPWMMRAVP